MRCEEATEESSARDLDLDVIVYSSGIFDEFDRRGLIQDRSVNLVSRFLRDFQADL